MFIDIHTHNSVFDPNIKKHFNYIVPTIFSEEFDLKNFDSSLVFSAGIHPWFINELELKEQYLYLRKVAYLSEVKIIGEAGLDKLKGSDFNIQEEIFIMQIRLAEEVQKPLIIHCVKSFAEMIAIKKVIKPKVPLILHGFNKKSELALELIRKGFYLSFGEALLKSSSIQEALKAVDLTKVFFETDSAACSIFEIYEKASQVLHIDIDLLKKKIQENYLELFIR